MAPKRAAAAKSAPAAKPKANTKAKVTKPAPATKGKVRGTKTAAKKATATASTTKEKAPAKSKAAPKTNGVAKPAAKTGRGRPKKEVVNETDGEAETKPAKTMVNGTTTTKSTNTTKKAATKKAPATTTTTKKTGTKRKAEDEAPSGPAKKTKALKKGPVLNEPPNQRLNVYVFGEGTAGELGLGTAKGAVDVKRPRLNPHLLADKVGIIQVSAGGMHVIALTHDNRILTWGVNDQGALGRDTTWEGGVRDMDAEEDSDDDEDDNGLNPKESMPGEVDFSQTELAEGIRFTEVAAGDSCSLALTDDGRVYGWGTFRSNEGIFGFTTDVKIASRPILLPDLKKITSIRVGANHALALDNKGAVFAWGSGQQNQLGRRVVERTKAEGLKPREFGLPKGAKNGITNIETGGYHSFAIAKNGDVYSWGLNNFGETGIMANAGQDDAVILKPQVIEPFKGKTIVSIKGGGHHSIAATSEGDCFVWGRLDGSQMGISDEDLAKLPASATVKDNYGKPRILGIPQKVTAIDGAVTKVATSSDHSLAITAEGKAWSWGFSANYQTGQGTTEDVHVATMIDNTAVREKKLNFATTGGQFSILTCPADVEMVNGV